MAYFIWSKRNTAFPPDGEGRPDSMPQITLRLRGQLAASPSGDTEIFEVAPETSLGVFLADHALGARHYVVMLNNTVSPDRNTVLRDRDLVTVYPQMAGG